MKKKKKKARWPAVLPFFMYGKRLWASHQPDTAPEAYAYCGLALSWVLEIMRLSKFLPRGIHRKRKVKR